MLGSNSVLLIPMRGNEFTAKAFSTSSCVVLLIPMRGNEFDGYFHRTAEPVYVTDPHEG